MRPPLDAMTKETPPSYEAALTSTFGSGAGASASTYNDSTASRPVPRPPTQQAAEASLTRPPGPPASSPSPWRSPTPPEARPAVFEEDRYQDAPPRYDAATQTASSARLPQQDYPVYSTNPADYAPAPRPPAGYQPYPAPGMPSGMYAPPTMGPTLNWYGYGPPPGAVTVMPGDPRIGGVLCPTCRGSGNSYDLFSLFMLGDNECDTCGGTGRVGWR